MVRFALVLLILVVVSESASACPLAGRLRSRVVSSVRHVERARTGLFGRPAVVAVQASPCQGIGCKMPAAAVPVPPKK